jgi:micrococcal nuclease
LLKKFSKILNWTFALFAFFLLGSYPPASAKTIEGKVLKVFDGDTFLVRVQGKEEHVRLREIDAPEIAHPKQPGQEPWGKAAKDFAQSLVRGKTVSLEIEERDERDKYQRLLAYVFRGQTLVNAEMLRTGNAFFYPSSFRGEYTRELEKAEEEAKEKGLGVWDRKRGLQERPQDFRRRTRRDEGFFPQFRHLLGAEEKSKTFKEYPVAEGKIVGNKRSMIYHLPGGLSAKRVSPKNRVYFDSPEEAEKAGFRPANKAVISDR